MTLAEQLKAADDLETLWRGLFPGLAAPERRQFLMWVDMDPEVAAFALNRTARKSLRQASTDTPMTSDAVARYVTAVIRDELTKMRRADRTRVIRFDVEGATSVGRS